MNILLIARSECVCLAILLFLFFSSLFYWENEDKHSFLKMCAFALGHVTFDLITLYTVNHLDEIPLWVNNLVHIIFYEFAILFCCEFAYYVVRQVFSYQTARRIIAWSRLVPILYPLTLPFLSIDYLEGNGTNYSFGPSVFLGYGLAMTIFLLSFIMVLFSKKIEHSIRHILLPMLTLMLISIVLQIFIPELLFTGAAVTLVVVAMYVAVENPINKYKQQAYFDMGTGLRNRNCYDEDIKSLEVKQYYQNKKIEITYIICDLNNLKKTNDTYGHSYGDELIRMAAQLLSTHFKHAYRIYRIGGDEFATIYLNEKPAVIENEIQMLQNGCANTKTSTGLPFSMALGYATTNESTSLRNTIRIADKKMYENKAEMKKSLIR